MEVIKHYEATYIMKPVEGKRVCEESIARVLTGKSWNGEEESVWANEIADNIRAALKADADLPRYKIIVQVVLGEMKNQGVRVASRCLWDTDTDNYASVSFKNDKLWCVAMVFACYTE